jgi:hypothetical protein
VDVLADAADTCRRIGAAAERIGAGSAGEFAEVCRLNAAIEWRRPIGAVSSCSRPWSAVQPVSGVFGPLEVAV